MFCLTVSQGNTPYSWKITPRSGPGPAIGCPSSSTCPASGFMNPATMFIIVVLPQPDGPITETNSRSRIAYETSSTTRSGPDFEGNSTETRSKAIRHALLAATAVNGLPSCCALRYSPSGRPVGLMRCAPARPRVDAPPSRSSRSITSAIRPMQMIPT